MLKEISSIGIFYLLRTKKSLFISTAVGLKSMFFGDII